MLRDYPTVQWRAGLEINPRADHWLWFREASGIRFATLVCAGDYRKSKPDRKPFCLQPPNSESRRKTASSLKTRIWAFRQLRRRGWPPSRFLRRGRDDDGCGCHRRSYRSPLLEITSQPVQGSTGLMPVSSQKSTNAGYKSLPYPRHAYSLVQLSSILSTSQ